MQSIYDLDIEQLQNWFVQHNQKPYRAKQVYNWLYKKRVSSFEEMSDLSHDLIEQLKEDFRIGPLEILEKHVAKDQTTKYLFALDDGSSIETVLMHFNFGKSVCITTQVGCNMGCAFCASGLLKKQRDLTAGEMVNQILMVQKDLDEQEARVDNIVVMGTGEPFDNYEEVLRFCKIVNSVLGLAIGARHISISNCGIVQMIELFADEHYQYNLAISLHAPNDELRNQLMPINKAYPINTLISALKRYSVDNHRRLTIEYILLKDVNDKDIHAKELANLLQGMNAYVNLIPYNEVDEHGFKATDEKGALHFYDLLMKHGVKATLRSKHGDDINAACGQLRARHEGV